MASAFAHAAAGAALWPLFRTQAARPWTWAAGATLAAAPDLDVIGFRFGIKYGDLLGHRGLTHSLFFALTIGLLIGWLLTRRSATAREHLQVSVYLFLATASHGLLDAMTNGGLGVALLAPLESARYFFPWQPIEVSPIGVGQFFTSRGLEVLANEAIWVGLPSLAVAGLGLWLRRKSLSPTAAARAR